MSELSIEDMEKIGARVADTMMQHFGREAALQLSLPIAVVMQTLEDAGALVPIVDADSVRTESDDDEYTLVVSGVERQWETKWTGKGFVAATAKMIDAQKTHVHVGLVWMRGKS